MAALERVPLFLPGLLKEFRDRSRGRSRGVRASYRPVQAHVEILLSEHLQGQNHRF
jgi:hypothetical protein